LPLAQSGLDRAGVDPADSARYLGILDKRIRSGRTGSRWMLQSLGGMQDRGNQGGAAHRLVAATIARQKTDRVVSEWERARLDENDSARTGYQKVSQYMTTDMSTVRPDDPVELVADLNELGADPPRPGRGPPGRAGRHGHLARRCSLLTGLTAIRRGRAAPAAPSPRS